MLRGLLSFFLPGKLFRMFSGHHRAHPVHDRSRAHPHFTWGRRSHRADLAGLMGFQRRRRSFI